MKKSYVYKITCKITDEYYFGSSFNAKSDQYWGGGTKIRERIAQYGKENFVKEILGEFYDRTIAHQVENQYIEKFRNDEKCLNIACDHKFGTYSDETREKHSVSTCGEKNHNFGKHFSEEHRAKIGASQRGENHHYFGKHLSEDHRAKIGAAMCGEKNHNFGKTFSDETRAKLSASLRGKNLSEEHRAKIGAAKLGKHWRKNPITGKREWYD